MTLSPITYEAANYSEFDCDVRTVTYLSEYSHKIEHEDGCVYEGQHIKLAVIGAIGFSGRLVVSFGHDSIMYPLVNHGLGRTPFSSNSGFIYLEPGGTRVVSAVQRQLNIVGMDIIDDFHAKLTFDSATKTYSLNQSTEVRHVQDPRGGELLFRRMSMSNNGKWAVVYNNTGLLVVNILTGEARYISNRYLQYATSSWLGAITNDGRYVAVNSAGAYYHSPILVYDLADNCSVQPQTLQECHVAEYQYPDLTHDSNFPVGLSSMRFDYSSDYELIFKTSPWASEAFDKHAVFSMYASGYEPRRLDYLALGDSYSSGEGDIGRQANGGTYYLPGTDAGNDNCHISSRSYPFLLRDAWKIDSTRMQSVACSGARLALDYFDPHDSYLGQDDRLRGVPNIREVQNVALKQFKPGHIAQLEFVKKYKPKVVTFTAGGNDIGFGNILRYCASSFGTCNYASDARLQNSLNRLIDIQYDNLVAFIQAMQAASPEARILMISYPKFISETIGTCNLNSAFLDASEIRMINQGVERLNRSIKRAAADTGLYYIDVERSLQGGALCDVLNVHFVTGYEDVGFDRNSSDMFHPNAAGHTKLAADIYEQSKHPTIPNSPGVPATTSDVAKLTFSSITGAGLIAGGLIDIELSAGHFAPNSTVKVGIYSEYTELATLQTDEHGGLNATITLPANVHPGYHVLSIIGESLQGGEVDVQQFVTVTSTNPDDIDGDGIPNSEDRCDFIPYWYDDNGRDVCVSDQTVAGPRKQDTPAVNVSSYAEANHLQQLQSDVARDIATVDQHDRDRDAEQKIVAGLNIGMNHSVYLWVVGGGIIAGGAILVTWLTINKKRRNRQKRDAHI